MAKKWIEGYDCEFVEPPPKALQVKCPVCLLILREPHLTSCCGNSFCESCIGAIKGEGKPCPYCKQPDFMTLANQGFRRALSEFQVHCSYHSLGCTWAGALGELEKHLNANPKPETKLEGCQFTDVVCIYCKDSVQRCVITDHQSEQCPKRPYTCEYCEDYESTFDDVTNAHWAECKCFPLPCPNSCSLSDSGIKRQDLEHHVEVECPLTMVECELHHAGCEVKLPRKDMAGHMKDLIHISLLAAENQKLTKQLLEKDQKIDMLTREVTLLRQAENQKLLERDEKIDILTREVSLLRQAVVQPNYNIQKQKLQPLLGQRLRKGDTWFLVDVRWMKQWKRYVGYDQWDQSNAGQEEANPGPMDNAGLFKDPSTGTLKDHLMEEIDYSLLPEPAWNVLLSWYSLTYDSQPISRKVVEYGLYMKHCKVEVYLLEFKLSMHPNLSNVTVTPFSRATTVADLEQVLRRTFDVPSDAECCVWHRYMTTTYELLSSPQQTLQDAGLYNGQTIVLEQRNKDGTWPRTTVNSSTHPTRSSDNITGSATASSSYSSTSSSSWGKKNYGSSSSSSSSSGYSSYWSSGYSQQPTTPEHNNI